MPKKFNLEEVGAFVEEHPIGTTIDYIGSKKEFKARIALLEYEFIELMGKVADFGTQKYAEEDWRDNPKVKVKERIDSAYHHLGKLSSAHHEDYDEESKLHHAGHLAFNGMMIYWIAKYRSERDNRYKGPKPNTNLQD